MKTAHLLAFALLLAFVTPSFAIVDWNAPQTPTLNFTYNAPAQAALLQLPPSLQNATYLKNQGIQYAPNQTIRCDYVANNSQLHYCVAPRMQFYFTPPQFNLSAVSGPNAWLPAVSDGFYYYFRSPHQPLGIISLPANGKMLLEMDYADPVAVTQDLAWMRDANIIPSYSDDQILHIGLQASNQLTNPSFKSDPRGWAADMGNGLLVSYRTADSLKPETSWPQKGRVVALLNLPVSSPAASASSPSASIPFAPTGTVCADPWGPITTFQNYSSIDSQGRTVSCYQKNTALLCRTHINQLASNADWTVCDHPGTCSQFVDSSDSDIYVCYRPLPNFPDKLQQCGCRLSFSYCRAQTGTFFLVDKSQYYVSFSYENCREYGPSQNTAPSAAIPSASVTPSSASTPSSPTPPSNSQMFTLIVPPPASVPSTSTPPAPSAVSTPAAPSTTAPPSSLPDIIPTLTPEGGEPVPPAANQISVLNPPIAPASTTTPVASEQTLPPQPPSVPSSVAPTVYPTPSAPISPPAFPPTKNAQIGASTGPSGAAGTRPSGSASVGRVESIASAPSGAVGSSGAAPSSSNWPSWATPALAVMGVVFLAVLAFYFRPTTVMAPGPMQEQIYLSDARLELMESLSEADRIPTDLSNMLGKSKSTVVEHLEGLVQAGLVERVETPGRKFVFYRLTHLGRDLLLRKKNEAQ